jgi:hypothetical protein
MLYRFAPPSHLLPTSVAPGPGYRPPFPQARFIPQPRPPFLQPQMQAPDWYNVMNENIYGNRKVDINCIVSIVRGDNQLRHFMQGGSSLPIVFYLLFSLGMCIIFIAPFVITKTSFCSSPRARPGKDNI